MNQEQRKPTFQKIIKHPKRKHKILIINSLQNKTCLVSYQNCATTRVGLCRSLSPGHELEILEPCRRTKVNCVLRQGELTATNMKSDNLSSPV